MKKEIITQSDPKSPISEVFRALRTNLQFMSKASGCQTILITSTVQSEGKSWISANLATAFAQTGIKTLIIDADMRKPRQHKIFQVDGVPGLSNYLSKIDEKGRRHAVNALDCIKRTEVDNLDLLPSGNIPPNPSELLMSDKTIELLKEVSEIYDVVIFDGAPCLLVTDSTILSRIVDNTLLVTSYKYTKVDDLKEAKKRIQRVGGNIAGVVLNRIEINNKKYESKYYYSSQLAPSTEVKGTRRNKERDVREVRTNRESKDHEDISENRREKYDTISRVDKRDKIDNIERSTRKLQKEDLSQSNFKIQGIKEKQDKKDEEIKEYVQDKVKDTEEKIREEIKRNSGKRFSEIEEVPSDKAREILESIKSFK